MFVLFSVLILILLYYWSQFTISTSHFIKNGPLDLKILQLTDLHNNKFGKNQKKIVEIINKENPDIIVITGDMNAGLKIDNFELLLKQLPNIPKFFVTGNHEEVFIKDRTQLKMVLQENNVKVLNNDIVEIKGISLYGINDCLAENPKNYKDVDGYSVLITHRPDYALNIANNEYDLILTGHMHGGQWRLPWINTGFISPYKTLFPKYSAGRYELNDKTTMIVCRGLGTMTIVPRIFNRPEIAIVQIKHN